MWLFYFRELQRKGPWGQEKGIVGEQPLDLFQSNYFFKPCTIFILTKLKIIQKYKGDKRKHYGTEILKLGELNRRPQIRLSPDSFFWTIQCQPISLSHLLTSPIFRKSGSWVSVWFWIRCQSFLGASFVFVLQGHFWCSWGHAMWEVEPIAPTCKACTPTLWATSLALDINLQSYELLAVVLSQIEPQSRIIISLSKTNILIIPHFSWNQNDDKLLF